MDTPSWRFRLTIGGRRLETLRPKGDAEPSADKPGTEMIGLEMAYLGTGVTRVKIRRSWVGEGAWMRSLISSLKQMACYDIRDPVIRTDHRCKVGSRVITLKKTRPFWYRRSRRLSGERAFQMRRR